MTLPSWVIPVASLGAICVVALVFVWWWFPRAWRKGTLQEFKLHDAEQHERNLEGDPDQPERDRTWAREVIARATAKGRGEDVSGWELPERPRWAVQAPPPAYAA